MRSMFMLLDFLGVKAFKGHERLSYDEIAQQIKYKLHKLNKEDKEKAEELLKMAISDRVANENIINRILPDFNIA